MVHDMSNTVPTSARLSVETKRKLVTLAVEYDRSESWVIENAIKAFYESNTPKPSED